MESLFAYWWDSIAQPVLAPRVDKGMVCRKYAADFNSYWTSLNFDGMRRIISDMDAECQAAQNTGIMSREEYLAKCEQQAAGLEIFGGKLLIPLGVVTLRGISLGECTFRIGHNSFVSISCSERNHPHQSDPEEIGGYSAFCLGAQGERAVKQYITYGEIKALARFLARQARQYSPQTAYRPLETDECTCGRERAINDPDLRHWPQPATCQRCGRNACNQCCPEQVCEACRRPCPVCGADLGEDTLCVRCDLPYLTAWRREMMRRIPPAVRSANDKTRFSHLLSSSPAIRRATVHDLRINHGDLPYPEIHTASLRRMARTLSSCGDGDRGVRMDGGSGSALGS